jgi:hypothetical protein
MWHNLLLLLREWALSNTSAISSCRSPHQITQLARIIGAHREQHDREWQVEEEKPPIVANPKRVIVATI